MERSTYVIWENAAVLVMSYFRAEAEALHFAVSGDGLIWRALNANRPILNGEVGAKSLRDPFVLQDERGVFHLLATNGWRADSIIHAVSSDLLHWSDQELLPVMQTVPGTRNCWAPEGFYDREAACYRLIWSSTVSANDRRDWNSVATWASAHDHRIWQTTTRDFQTYTPAALFFDPGYSVIDATVAPDGDGYLMAFKDERGENHLGTTNKAIRVCRSPRGDGPWTDISAPVTPPLTEGPALFRQDGRWLLLFDHFAEGFYDAAQSEDGLHWTPIAEPKTFPPGARHAGVLKVSDEISAGLLSHLRG